MYYNCGNFSYVCEFCGAFFGFMKGCCIYLGLIINLIPSVVNQGIQFHVCYDIVWCKSANWMRQSIKVMDLMYSRCLVRFPIGLDRRVHKTVIIPVFCSCICVTLIMSFLIDFVLSGVKVVCFYLQMLWIVLMICWYVRTFKMKKGMVQSMNLDSYVVRLFNSVPVEDMGYRSLVVWIAIVYDDDFDGF
uniref:Uncharacterized protein n=1 Tax=Lactuca sativa TaxID=4236 RepID=A0A9R1V5K8_LACSA|nr:hypothetical protein LSAT_V11C600321450 [Lactuca sativa]